MSNKTECKIAGVIEARFGWNAFPKQHSCGLISGLVNKNTAIDCDSRAIFCGKDGKPISMDMKRCCVSYDNRTMFDNKVIHGGDNQTGGNDAERITLDLDSIPSDVDHTILSLDLFKEKKKIGSGKIHEAFLRLYYKETGEKTAGVDIGYLNNDITIVVAGRLNREKNEWYFVPDGTVFTYENMESFLYSIG